jgi:hypothetical protein
MRRSLGARPLRFMDDHPVMGTYFTASIVWEMSLMVWFGVCDIHLGQLDLNWGTVW